MAILAVYELLRGQLDGAAPPAAADQHDGEYE
jgi:hypothetical protein